VLVFCLGACTDSTVYLKNPKTGEIVQCGNFHAVTLVENSKKDRDLRCVDDYEAQGFVRVPGPK
jgi:hypothetical protein